MEDIYFDCNYGKLYEKMENGINNIFKMETQNGKITNQFIKRKISIETIPNDEYYDIITPYGYGGPIIEYCNGSKKKLINEYEIQFKKYCEKNKIVSEFVRFHPLMKNYEDFYQTYDATYMRKTLITKLQEEDVIKNQFGKSCRKNIRQAMNKGITYKITESPENIGCFKEIYYSTMDRNNATDYYYFDDEYFNNILKIYKKNVILVEAIFKGKTIAAGLYFIYKDIIHIHLSGTLTEYLYLSPAYILRYAVTLWGIEKGYKTIHHGGGRSNDKTDSLYLFKKNFAKLYDSDFYVGKKIWNKEIYSKLCKIKNVDENSDYFPAYRKQVK